MMSFTRDVAVADTTELMQLGDHDICSSDGKELMFVTKVDDTLVRTRKIQQKQERNNHGQRNTGGEQRFTL